MKSHEPAWTPGFCFVITLANWIAAIVIVGLLLFWVPTVHAAEQSLTLPLPPHIQEQCEAAGGCVLIPRAVLEAEVEKVKQEALMQGYLAGAADASDKGCRRAL